MPIGKCCKPMGKHFTKNYVNYYFLLNLKTTV